MGAEDLTKLWRGKLTRLNLVAVLLLSIAPAGLAQTTLLSDDFTDVSTTTYFLASSKAGSMSIAPHDMNIGMASTSGGIVELQALFGNNHPSAALATIGDYVDLVVTFTDTAGILTTPSTANSSINIGLFNSGGTSPLAGLENQGLNNTPDSVNATGGTQRWQGYNTRMIKSGSAEIQMRSQQIGPGTTSQNQDLLFDGASASQAYNNPLGPNVGIKGGTIINLLAGTIYTMEFKITLNGSNSLAISDTLYNGGAVNPANAIFNEQATAIGGFYLTNAFDGFSFGWRYVGATGDPASAMDVSQITVTDFIQTVPEPNSFAILTSGTWRDGFSLAGASRIVTEQSSCK